MGAYGGASASRALMLKY